METEPLEIKANILRELNDIYFKLLRMRDEKEIKAYRIFEQYYRPIIPERDVLGEELRVEIGETKSSIFKYKESEHPLTDEKTVAVWAELNGYRYCTAFIGYVSGSKGFNVGLPSGMFREDGHIYPSDICAAIGTLIALGAPDLVEEIPNKEQLLAKGWYTSEERDALATLVYQFLVKAVESEIERLRKEVPLSVKPVAHLKPIPATISYLRRLREELMQKYKKGRVKLDGFVGPTFTVFMYTAYSGDEYDEWTGFPVLIKEHGTFWFFGRGSDRYVVPVLDVPTFDLLRIRAFYLAKPTPVPSGIIDIVRRELGREADAPLITSRRRTITKGMIHAYERWLIRQMTMYDWNGTYLLLLEPEALQRIAGAQRVGIVEKIYVMHESHKECGNKLDAVWDCGDSLCYYYTRGPFDDVCVKKEIKYFSL